MEISQKKKWKQTIGIKGYYRPINSIGGIKFTYTDEKIPSKSIRFELKGFKKILRQHEIPFRTVFSESSNPNVGYFFIVVSSENLEKGSYLSYLYGREKNIRFFFSY